jgi:hypothetical protein
VESSILQGAWTWTGRDHGESLRILRTSFSSHCLKGFDFQGSVPAVARAARQTIAIIPKINLRIVFFFLMQLAVHFFAERKISPVWIEGLAAYRKLPDGALCSKRIFTGISGGTPRIRIACHALYAI